MTDGDDLPGALLRHVKRNTTYRGVALATGDLRRLADGEAAVALQDEVGGIRIFRPEDGLFGAGRLSLDITVQVSCPPAPGSEPVSATFLVYRCIGDGRYWARPVAEFTPDRFERLAI